MQVAEVKIWASNVVKLKFCLSRRYLPPPKEGGYVVTFVCLSVRLFVCPLDYSKSYEQIMMNSLEGWDVAKKQLIGFWWRFGSRYGYRVQYM